MGALPADQLVEACAVAMVREFLARRGMRDVLAIFDQSRPPTASDILSRHELMRQVSSPLQPAATRPVLGRAGTAASIRASHAQCA
jgi:hypothetical protein